MVNVQHTSITTRHYDKFRAIVSFVIKFTRGHSEVRCEK